MRLVVSAAGLLMLVGVLGLHAEENEPAVGSALFNGKDLTGWKLRLDPADKQNRCAVVAAVKL